MDLDLFEGLEELSELRNDLDSEGLWDGQLEQTYQGAAQPALPERSSSMSDGYGQISPETSRSDSMSPATKAYGQRTLDAVDRQPTIGAELPGGIEYGAPGIRRTPIYASSGNVYNEPPPKYAQGVFMRAKPRLMTPAGKVRVPESYPERAGEVLEPAEARAVRDKAFNELDDSGALFEGFQLAADPMHFPPGTPQTGSYTDRGGAPKKFEAWPHGSGSGAGVRGGKRGEDGRRIGGRGHRNRHGASNLRHIDMEDYRGGGQYSGRPPNQTSDVRLGNTVKGSQKLADMDMDVLKELEGKLSGLLDKVGF